MKALSIILCALDAIGVFFVLSMDTTVLTGDGVRVHNIGLVSDRQTYLIVSGLLLLVGVILFGFSTLRSPVPQSSASPNVGAIASILVLVVLVGLVSWLSLTGKSSSMSKEPSHRVSMKPSSVDNSLKLQLEPFTIKLSSTNNYLQTTIVLILGDSADKRAIEDFLPEIRYALLLLLETKSLAQISDESGKASLTKEICGAVNEIVRGTASVKEVQFASFVTT